ncbi:MAG TPA: hypothetical protein VIO61_09270 [Anaerolineaceae bacterium]
MQTILQQIIAILTEPPGNLVYHLVLAFSAAITLQFLLVQPARQGVYRLRSTAGLTLILGSQLLLFIASAIAWQGVINPHTILPPLDRIVGYFSLIWIIWLWAFPKPSHVGDLMISLFSFLTLIFGVVSVIFWQSQGAALPYNLSSWDLAWLLCYTCTAGIGSILLVIRRSENWINGCSMLLILAIGALGHLVFNGTAGDFAGLLRLAQLVAYPLLPMIAARGLSHPAQPPQMVNGISRPGFPREKERRRYSADIRTVQTWLHFASENQPDKSSLALVRAVAQSMLADMGYLLALHAESSRVNFQGGYDLIREELLPSMAIDPEKIPNLAGAIKRQRAIRLSAVDQNPDLTILGEMLGLTETGSAIFVPLALPDTPLAGLLMLSPYSRREWQQEDQNYLISIASLIPPILTQVEERQDTDEQGVNQIPQLQTLQERLAILEQQNAALTQDLTKAQLRLKQPAQNRNYEEILAMQQELQNLVTALQAENEQLHQVLSGSGEATMPASAMQHMEEELQASLKQVAVLQNALAVSNQRIYELEQANKPSHIQVEPAEIPTINQARVELRQSFESIDGYTDILLTDQVGSLTSIQRRFVERIKAACERVASLLTQLEVIGSTQSDTENLSYQDMDLELAIDEAIQATTTQLREKSLSLLVDLPDSLPTIKANPMAIRQTIISLLETIGQATPPEGSINLIVKVSQEQETRALNLQVSQPNSIYSENLKQTILTSEQIGAVAKEGGLTSAHLSLIDALVRSQNGKVIVGTDSGQLIILQVQLPISAKEESAERSE